MHPKIENKRKGSRRVVVERRWWRWRHACTGAREEMLHIHICIYSRCTHGCVFIHICIYSRCTHGCVLYCAWHARTLPHALAWPHVMHARQAVDVPHFLRSLFCFQHANLVERNHRVRRYTYLTTHMSDISHHTCVGTCTYLAYICRVRTYTQLAYVCCIHMLP